MANPIAANYLLRNPKGKIIGVCIFLWMAFLSKISIADGYAWNYTDYSETVTVERCKVRGEAISQEIQNQGHKFDLQTTSYTVWFLNLDNEVDIFIGCIENKKTVVFVVKTRSGTSDKAAEWVDWLKRQWKRYDLIQ